MAQQVSTGCYFRAFSVELCEESAVTGKFIPECTQIASALKFQFVGPWSIHRGTPRNGQRVVLRCSSEAPEGASSGIQILPPSYHRARKLSDLIMRRSAVWLGIPTVSYNVRHSMVVVAIAKKAYTARVQSCSIYMQFFGWRGSSNPAYNWKNFGWGRMTAQNQLILDFRWPRGFLCIKGWCNCFENISQMFLLTCCR